MRVEVPELKRCCFCIPLRYGLLGWAYTKLVLTVLYASLILLLCTLVVFSPWYVPFFFILAILLCLADIGFTIVFIIGAHKKNYKLIRIYYYFAIGAVGVSTALYFISLCLQLRRYANSEFPPEFKERMLRSIVETALIFGLQLILQGYLIVLIRSEFLKLKKNCKFQFVNNEAKAEAECRLNVNNDVTSKGKQLIV